MERFCQYPSCTEFILSSPDDIQLVIRRHWLRDVLFFVQWFFWGPLLLSFGGIFFLFDLNFSKDLITISISSALFYLLLETFHFFSKWINHAFDIIFVTKDRVIDVSQVSFWHRNIIETRLDHVQDATGDVNGFLETLLDWGTVKIRTANDVADFSIESIQYPHQKARKIFDLANKARKKEIESSSSSQKHKGKNKKNWQQTFQQDSSPSIVRHYEHIKAVLRHRINEIMKSKK